ncbi:MAG: hypothetical protein COB37_03180 [Kordiimonadales bacterium]|nr:MAG: hypothetical protein COB37_03180 [Kordiimonadales bacterium]
MIEEQNGEAAVQPKNFKQLIKENLGERLSFEHGVLYTARMVLFQPWRACRDYMDAHDPRVSNPVSMILTISAVMVVLYYFFPMDEMLVAMQQSQQVGLFVDADTPEKLAAAQEAQASAEKANSFMLPFLNLLGEFPFVSFLIFVPLYALAFKWAAYGKMPYFRALVFTAYCSVSSTIWLTLPQHIAYQVLLADPRMVTVINSFSAAATGLTFIFFFFAYKNLQGRSGISSFLRTLLSVFWLVVIVLLVIILIVAGVIGYMVMTKAA